MADSSRRTRHHQWKELQDFSTKFKFFVMPAWFIVHTVALYATFLAREVEFSTVLNYVCAIVTLHQHHNMIAPDLESLEIREALGGIKRSRHGRPNKRAPVNPNQLLAFYGSLNALAKTFCAACVTAFFSLLKSKIHLELHPIPHFTCECATSPRKIRNSYCQ